MSPETDKAIEGEPEPQVPRPEKLYYAITLTADDAGKVTFGYQTVWAGWADDQRRHELRQARLVYRDFTKLWESIRQPFVVVHTLQELTGYLVAGGHALIEKNICEKVLGHMLGPKETFQVGSAGFVGRGLLQEGALYRAPSPKMRMKILNRGDRRCKICGRSPRENADIVLHIHHIRPWARGGVTDPINQITLCHTCHDGLAPHEDHSLFSYVDSRASNRVEQYLLEHLKGVENYRRVGFLGSERTNNRLKKTKKKQSAGVQMTK